MMDSLSTHVCEDCDSCKGASANRYDHYALGKLRHQIALELHIEGQVLELPVLLKKWRDSRRAA